MATLTKGLNACVGYIPDSNDFSGAGHYIGNTLQFQSTAGIRGSPFAASGRRLRSSGRSRCDLLAHSCERLQSSRCPGTASNDKGARHRRHPLGPEDRLPDLPWQASASAACTQALKRAHLVSPLGRCLTRIIYQERKTLEGSATGAQDPAGSCTGGSRFSLGTLNKLLPDAAAGHQTGISWTRDFTGNGLAARRGPFRRKFALGLPCREPSA